MDAPYRDVRTTMDTLETLRLKVLFLEGQVRALDAMVQELRQPALQPKTYSPTFVPPARYGLDGWYQS